MRIGIALRPTALKHVRDPDRKIESGTLIRHPCLRPRKARLIEAHWCVARGGRIIREASELTRTRSHGAHLSLAVECDHCCGARNRLGGRRRRICDQGGITSQYIDRLGRQGVTCALGAQAPTEKSRTERAGSAVDRDIGQDLLNVNSRTRESAAGERLREPSIEASPAQCLPWQHLLSAATWKTAVKPGINRQRSAKLFQNALDFTL